MIAELRHKDLVVGPGCPDPAIAADAGEGARFPRLSVGLAVFNGERFLSQAIDSILGQSFNDFELIISDNASTDRTAEICRAYAASDRRIRYHRNSINIGGANNENWTFTAARGEYFRWAAHDDVCAPGLFEKCIEVLDRNPDVVLSYPLVTEIDSAGHPLRMLAGGGATTGRPHERFRRLMKLDHHCVESYGVIRSVALRQTRLQQNYTDSDRTLLAELALQGRFYELPEPLFFRRIHPGKSTVVYPDWRERMVWFDASYRTRIALPHWLQFVDYLKTIGRARLQVRERARCYVHMIPWLLKDGHARWIVKDVVLAMHRLLARMIARSGRTSEGH